MIPGRVASENLGRAIAIVRQYDSDVERYSAQARRLGTEMLAAHVVAYETSTVRKLLYKLSFSPEKEPPQIRAHRMELERRGIKTE